MKTPSEWRQSMSPCYVSWYSWEWEEFIKEVQDDAINRSHLFRSWLLITIKNNKWSISYNSRIQKWIVQEPLQVCGNIGEDKDLDMAIVKAMVKRMSTPTRTNKSPK